MIACICMMSSTISTVSAFRRCGHMDLSHSLSLSASSPSFGASIGCLDITVVIAGEGSRLSHRDHPCRQLIPVGAGLLVVLAIRPPRGTRAWKKDST